MEKNYYVEHIVMGTSPVQISTITDLTLAEAESYYAKLEPKTTTIWIAKETEIGNGHEVIKSKVITLREFKKNKIKEFAKKL